MTFISLCYVRNEKTENVTASEESFMHLAHTVMASVRLVVDE